MSARKKTRIVAVTGHAELKGSSRMSNFDGCLVKPIEMQALEALLNADQSSPVWLGRRQLLKANGGRT